MIQYILNFVSHRVSFQEMSADVYSKLLMALVMPDQQETSCYPVRVSAAGAITTLLEVRFQFSDLFWTGFFCSFFSFT